MAVGAVQEQLAVVIANQQFHVVAQVLDRAELESRNPDVLQEDWPHALHLLGHIYNRHLEDARFVWKRIPLNIKQNNSELQAVWRLLQFLWQRQYPAVWQALQAHAWSAPLQPLVRALADKLRRELMDLISTAYSTVRLGKVAALCGLTEAEALEAGRGAGWRWDAATSMLHVTPLSLPTTQAVEGAEREQDAPLGALNKYMAHLEA